MIPTNQTPHYNTTMQNYHDLVSTYNKDKEPPLQIRNGVKHTGEHIYRIWMMSFQGGKTKDYSFETSLKSMSTRLAKSERSIIRHLDQLLEAKLIDRKAYFQRGLFTVTINREIVRFLEKEARKVIHKTT